MEAPVEPFRADGTTPARRWHRPHDSVISICSGGPGQRVVCARDNAQAHVLLVLELDRCCDLVWIERGFDERISGALVRLDV